MKPPTPADFASGGLLLLALLSACSAPPRLEPAVSMTPSSLPSAGALATPGPTTTGVPPGTLLTPSSTIFAAQDGMVIANRDIIGCLVIAADNVTVRDTRIRCYDGQFDRAVLADGDHFGTLLEDVEIDGGGTTDIGVELDNVVLRRVNIHSVNDGIRFGEGLTLEDSWVHDLDEQAELHPDAVQGISGKDVVLRGNYLDPTNSRTGDPGNAAIMLGSELGDMTSRNILIENNYIDGGACSLNIRGDIHATDYVIQNNTFGDGATYCSALIPRHIALGSGNVDQRSGAEIVPEFTPESE